MFCIFDSEMVSHVWPQKKEAQDKRKFIILTGRRDRRHSRLQVLTRLVRKQMRGWRRMLPPKAFIGVSRGKGKAGQGEQFRIGYLE